MATVGGCMFPTSPPVTPTIVAEYGPTATSRPVTASPAPTIAAATGRVSAPSDYA